MAGNFAERKPATAAQQRLWLVDQQGPRGVEFSFPYVFELHGRCDPERLADAVGRLVARHAALRTTFVLDGEVLEQHVHPPSPACFEYAEVPGDEADLLISDETATPFDLVRDWPLRVRLYRTGEAEFRLLFNVHHIATDGISMQIMLDEVAAGYRGARLPELAADPGERADPDPDETSDGLDFWTRMLTDAPAPPTLPGGRPARKAPSFSGRWFDFELSPERTARLDHLARTARASTFCTLFGLLSVVLGRHTGVSDIVLGVPFSGRQADDENRIGFFVNLLPVRFAVDERMTPRRLCAAATEAVAAVLEHSRIPLDRIVERLRLPVGGVGSLLDITLTEEQTPRLSLAGVDVVYRHTRPDVARYYLAVDYRRLDSGALLFEVSYGKDRLSRGQVATVLADLVALILAAADEPDRPLATLAGATGAVSLLAEPQAEPSPESLASLWRDAVARHGDRTAVVDHDGDMTFAELDRHSAELARRLADSRVRTGDPVALATGRSRDFFVALLATLRVGATPVLLDAGHPALRLADLVRRSGARVTLCSAEDAVAGNGITVRATESGTAPDHWHDRPAGALAYVVFTSGSTGNPKCVGVEDAGLLRLLTNLTTLGLAVPGQRIALNASLGFDASVQQWVRIFAGCAIAILDERTRLDPAELPRYLTTHEIAELDISPRHLDAVLDSLLDELRRGGTCLRLLIGGEALAPPLWSRLRDAISEGLLVCWNMYGPSENTVDSTVFPLAMADTPTIGVPLPGIRAYVLDDWLRPVPLGTPGQLFLAGDGIGRGYLDAPGTTARAFLADPIACDGSRMYATGDRVRITSDHLLEFLGRGDDQAKINGYRVEPMELEAAALAHPGVRGCAVLVDRSGPLPALELFAVCAPESLESLPKWLASRLPSYLVPRGVHRISAIPTGPGGKVDRHALAAMLGRPEPVTVPDEPPVEDDLSTTEKLIAEVWREVLRTPEITGDDDFFSLGGHSLLAIRVVARIRKDTGVALPIPSVFAFPVLRDLAAHVETLRGQRSTVAGS